MMVPSAYRLLLCAALVHVAAAQSTIAPLPAEWNGQPVLKIGAGVSAPQFIHSHTPQVCTNKNMDLHTPLLAFIVDTDGVPRNIVVSRSSGDASYDAKFVEAMRQTRFKPAMKDGRPVVVAISSETNVDCF